MVAFLEKLRAGLTKDEAPRAAMVALVEDGAHDWTDPHQWAAFLLVGDPENRGLGRGETKRKSCRERL